MLRQRVRSKRGLVPGLLASCLDGIWAQRLGLHLSGATRDAVPECGAGDPAPVGHRKRGERLMERIVAIWEQEHRALTAEVHDLRQGLAAARQDAERLRAALTAQGEVTTTTEETT